MTEELTKLLEPELLRCTKALRDVNPVEEIDVYEKLLSAINSIHWLVTRNQFRGYHPDPVGEPGEPGVPVDEPSVSVDEPDVEPEPEPERTYTKEEVRAALGEARKTGTNIPELLRSLGADNFTSLPASKYDEVMELLENRDA